MLFVLYFYDDRGEINGLGADRATIFLFSITIVAAMCQTAGHRWGQCVSVAYKCWKRFVSENNGTFRSYEPRTGPAAIEQTSSLYFSRRT